METAHTLYLPNQKFEDFYLCFCGYSTCKPGHHFGPAVRPNYLIHYILEGKGIYQTGGQTYHLSKGQGFLIEPETLTFYQADQHEPWSYLWIGFDGTHAKRYLRDIGLNEEQLIFQSPQREALEATLFAMLKHNGGTPSEHYLLQGLLYSFFAILTKDVVLDRPAATTQGNDHINKAIDFIRNNYFRGIGVLDIAEYLSMDRSYIYTLFKKNLGLSPKDFLTRFRITRAQELLVYTDFTIESVALSCGYQDTLVFSKAFKRATGDTPSSYRQVNRQHFD